MTPPRKATAVTVTITGTTTTTCAPAADTGTGPAAAVGDQLTPAPEGQHPDGLEPRPPTVPSEPAPYDLRVSDGPKAAWDDPPAHAAGPEAGS